jgi:DtxR family transcriptional regulator, Mn-dependent transcriptional regulator
MPQNASHSSIVENYIKSMYLIQEMHGNVSTTVLSERLNVSPASVTDMLKRLSEEGIINHKRYKGATLTKKGMKLALKILRRHRLWELFLERVLGFEWHELHDEAERLEHCTSDALEAKLASYLGNPTVDPHGHAIPQENGAIAVTDYTELSRIAGGETVTVKRVNDDSASVLKYAAELGIMIDRTLTVKERIEFDGTLRVLIHGKEQLISEKLATCIFVEQA